MDPRWPEKLVGGCSGAVGLAALLAGLACLAAGCGGGNPSAGVASLGPAATTTQASSGGPSPGSATAFVAFADCMQKHGIQVSVAKNGQGIRITGGGSPNASRLQTAQKACQKLLPGGGPQPLSPAQQAQNVRALVQLAACMRSHGYPSFPDPTSQGVFNLSAANGFDPNSPQFQSAMSTCQPKGARLRIGIAVRGPAPGG